MTNNKPHGGSVMEYAMQLQFIDSMIRDKIAQMIADQTIHLVWDKIKTPSARKLLEFIMANPRRPLAHEIRALLAAALDIECPSADEIPSLLLCMKDYPL